jgi:exopolysaccharide production protein ExoQ
MNQFQHEFERRGPARRDWHVDHLLFLAVSYLSILGMVLNEYWGPMPIGMAILGWMVLCVVRLPGTVLGFRTIGWFIWIVPLFALASALWSQEPNLTVRNSVWLGITTAIGALIAIHISVREFIIGVMFVTFPIVVLSIFFNQPYYDYLTDTVSYGGIFGTKNALAMACSLLVLSATAISLDRESIRLLRWFSIGAVCVGVVMALLSRSMGLTILMIGSAVIIYMVTLGRFFAWRNRSRYVDVFLVLGVIAAVVGIIGITFFQDQILAMLGKDSTLTGRTLLWDKALSVIPENPVLGVGYQAYWVWGYPVPELIWAQFKIGARCCFHFHNLFLEMAVELGVLGATLVGVVLLLISGKILKAVRRDPQSITGFFLGFFALAFLLDLNAVTQFMQFNPLYLILTTSAVYAHLLNAETEPAPVVTRPIRRDVMIANQ